jgi:hypothetical protein
MNDKFKVLSLIFSREEQFQETIEVNEGLSLTVIRDKFNSSYKNILFVTEREVGALKGLVGTPTKILIY